MSAVKALQQWCKIKCDGYRDVAITNMTTSFRDGLAFCALIHKHRPDLINFDSLKKDDVYKNNELAFRVAEEQLGIPALLDAEDMLALRVPDRLSILTYVSQYYNYFHGRSPIGGMAGVKRPAEVCQEEPSGKKNQPVVAKVFPSSNPARENQPPPSSGIANAPSSPKQDSRWTQKNVLVENTNQMGTLNNKCVSCHKHVHLVQRHLVDGKLYHRNCAKSATNAALRDDGVSSHVAALSTTTTPAFTIKTTKTETPTPTFTSKTSKTETPTPTFTSKTTKTETPTPTFTSKTSKTETPTPTFTSKTTKTETPTPTFTSKSTKTETPTPTFTSKTTKTETPTPTFTSKSTKTETPTPTFTSKTTKIETPSPTPTIFTSKTAKTETPTPTFTSKTTKITTTAVAWGDLQPVAAPRTSVIAARTRDAKLTFLLQPEEAAGSGSRSTAGWTDVGQGLGGSAGGGTPSPVARADEKSRAAAFISKRLMEENNNTTKGALPGSTNRYSPTEETPKKESGGLRTRVKLKPNACFLADLHTFPADLSTTPPATIAPASGPGESPAGWRSRLKPIAKETTPSGPAQTSPLPSAIKQADPFFKVWSAGPAKTQTPQGPTAPPSHRTPDDNQTKEGSVTSNGTKTSSSKSKPDYIPKDDITRELQEIEDSLNELEQRGVDLEKRLRHSEEEGEEDSAMDEVMIEWFALIRNKQQAMRRESELVYIEKNQDLEEQQPTVEQELRRLMEKPEYMKTFRDRQRETELMDKLVGIVNDRNAIIDCLDEDRLREDEEDEQFNKLMMNFDIKKDKMKKKSPMAKIFFWTNK